MKKRGIQYLVLDFAKLNLQHIDSSSLPLLIPKVFVSQAREVN
jgi:hypothetical protein